MVDEHKDIWDKIDRVDDKHTKKADELRAEMNVMVQTFQGHIADMTTSAAVISERFKQLKDRVVEMPRPEERPCLFFKEHMEDHKNIRFIWIRAIVGSVLSAVVTAIAAAIGTVLFMKKGS